MNKNDILWKLAYLAITGGVFMIDQVTKAWAVRRLRFGEDVSVISGFLNFAYAQNTGVAFSMLDDHANTGAGDCQCCKGRGVMFFIFFLENAAFR